MGWLLLGTDSLVACLAVGALLTKSQWVPFALMFGLADALGTFVGITFHWNVPDSTSTVVETAFMVGLGIYWIAVSAVSKRMQGTKWIWVLPWVLTVDNITYGTIDHAWSSAASVQALETGLSSMIQAALGIAVSVAIAALAPRVIRAMRSHRDGLPAMSGNGGGALTVGASSATISPAVVPAVAGVAIILAAVLNLLLG